MQKFLHFEVSDECQKDAKKRIIEYERHLEFLRKKFLHKS
jgi:hypothetical protein